MKFTTTVAAVMTLAGTGFAQSILIKDTFLLGDRATGNNGRVRTASVHTGLTDYWTLLPGSSAEAWLAPSNDPKWIFSASSIDALEWPEAEPNYNGTASGQAHAAALVPFTPPASAFTVHLDAVQFYSVPDGVKLGFTNSTALSDNFGAFSDLYLEFHGTGQWALMTHRQTTPLLSGDINAAYRLTAGFVPMTLSYDPATRRVGGMINGEAFGPVTLGFDPVITRVGFEAMADIVSYVTVNNFVVRTGGERLLTRQPTPWAGALGETATLTCASGAATNSWQWRRDGSPLSDGVTSWGSVISGSGSPSLTISGVGAGDLGSYDCVLISEAGVDLSDAVAVSRPPCTGDVTGDGVVNTLDLGAVLSRFGQAAPSGGVGDINGDGVVNTLDLGAILSNFGTACP